MAEKDSINNTDLQPQSDLSIDNELPDADSGPQPIPRTNKLLSQQEARLLGISSSFSGPLPPPDSLKAYDIVEPGLARKIFDLAEKQAQHRMELEKAVILGDGRRSWAGLCLGFVIACLFLGSSTYIIISGHDLAGGLLAYGGLASLVSVFIYGTNARVQERAEKRKALLGEEIDDN